MVEIIAVVVVLPCVPLMAIPYFVLIKTPKNSEYLTTFNPNDLAFLRSGLFSLIAAEVITRFVSGSRHSPSCFVLILTPSSPSSYVTGELSMSDPDTM